MLTRAERARLWVVPRACEKEGDDRSNNSEDPPQRNS